MIDTSVQEYQENAMDNECSPCGYLSQCRSELMGFAILWVVWFHSSFEVSNISIGLLRDILTFIKHIGFGGVDIFLLLSGMGIYRSLEKHPLHVYFLNRIRKIVPSWLVFLVIFFITGIFLLHYHFSGKELIGFATFTGFWFDMEHQGNWYVYGIMFLYLISPSLAYFLRKGRNKTLTWIVMVAVSILISFCFFNQFKLILFSRIPIYITGMYFAAELNHIPMEKKDWTWCLVVFVIGMIVLITAYLQFYDYAWSYGILWYPFLLTTPSFCLLFSWCFRQYKNQLKTVSAALKAMGQSSLEILLMTDLVFLIHDSCPFHLISDDFSAFIVMLTGILLGLLFHRFVEYGKSLIRFQ